MTIGQLKNELAKWGSQHDDMEVLYYMGEVEEYGSIDIVRTQSPDADSMPYSKSEAPKRLENFVLIKGYLTD